MFGVDDSQPAYSFDSTAQIESPSIEQFFKSIKCLSFQNMLVVVGARRFRLPLISFFNGWLQSKPWWHFIKNIECLSFQKYVGRCWRASI